MVYRIRAKSVINLIKISHFATALNLKRSIPETKSSGGGGEEGGGENIHFLKALFRIQIL